jgi:predicted nucleic acid-binding protein
LILSPGGSENLSFDIRFTRGELFHLLVEAPVDRSVVLAMRTISRAQVPDLPDRVIAATAVRLGVPLISRDGKIQASGVTTIW